MTNDAGSEALPHVEMSDVLTRVRQLDPAVEEAAVRVYMREMAEAEALLDTVDMSDAPLSISFSALWTEGGGQ